MHSSRVPNSASLISMRSRTYGTNGAQIDRPNPAMKKPTRVARRAMGEAASRGLEAAGIQDSLLKTGATLMHCLAGQWGHCVKEPQREPRYERWRSPIQSDALGPNQPAGQTLMVIFAFANMRSWSGT